MSLSQVFENALVAELQLPLYDALDATTAWHQFNEGIATTVQATIPVPYTLQQILGLVSAVSMAKLLAIPGSVDIRDKVQAEDSVGIGLWAGALFSGGVLTQADHDAIVAAVTATQTVNVTTKSEARIRTQFQTVHDVDNTGFPNAIGAADFTVAWLAASTVAKPRTGSVTP